MKSNIGHSHDQYSYNKTFLLTVKAGTLLFISGRGSAISSAKKGNQVTFIICRRVNKLFRPRKRVCIS